MFNTDNTESVVENKALVLVDAVDIQEASKDIQYNGDKEEHAVEVFGEGKLPSRF